VENYVNYSALLIDTARSEEALLYLTRARSLTMTYNERGQWFNNTGMAYFKLGKNTEALKNFGKATIFSPNEPQFWNNLGATYGYLGEFENSVLVLKRALEIVPDSISLRKNLAVTYIRMEDYEKAISVLEKIPGKNRDEFAINALLLKAQKAQMFHLPEIEITDQHKIEP
jgi:tetratricopeptide (TPR) repeat protein